MKPRYFLSLLFLGAAFSAQAGLVVAEAGKAKCVIVQSADATAPEIQAAKELATTLQQMTGALFAIQTGGEIPKHAIIVGPGPMAAKLFPEIDLGKFGPEELAVRVKGGHLLLAGGRPRGTLYAVNRFLSEQCGVRWWTPWATNIPQHGTLHVGNLDVREKPAFEYRGPYWSCAFEPEWKMHNGANNEASEIPTALGGSVTYKGFCHTFYPLVPPEKYFEAHPEWYSLVRGRRTHDRAQLCLTNPELRDFMVERVKAWLRESPGASIISVTQNDWDGHCECKDCKALDDAEGSHAGTMVAFANYVAEKIETEFPNVAVDTFAYQYTRHPPKTIKPRHNVIVRLCSIECNFREPLDHPSNAAFLADLEGWSKICSRLYIWDYVTDFKHYIRPHPDWFVLGPNMRLFEKFNVKGVFEEGAYAGPGAEMAEMRAWVLAQLMWNPKQDDRALMDEFLNGYYGAAGKFIRQYLDLLQAKSKDYYLATFTKKESPVYLQFPVLAKAEKLWQDAEAAVARDPELLARVRLGHLPVRFVWITDWKNLRRECWEQNATWPLATSRKAVVEEFRHVCAGVPGKDWTQVKVMSEGGESVDGFLKQFEVDPPEKTGPPPK
jgi:hypothetical protein